MADAVVAVPGTLQLVGEGWSLPAGRVEMLDGDGWRALVGVRRGLNLLVSRSDPSGELDVEAWVGEPEATDGIAVIDTGDGDIRLARVPLCSCGDRGCGNVGVQLARSLPGDELPALVELLRDLSWTETNPTTSNVLQGNGLAAIPRAPEAGCSMGEGSYLYAPGTGKVFPLSPANRRAGPAR